DDDTVSPSFGEMPEARGAGATAPKAKAEKPKSKLSGFSLRKAAIAAVALLAIAGGGYYGRYWWTTGRYLVTTDDAYVGARNATLSPKVAGYVSEIDFNDNDQVKAGTVLMRVDDGDYSLAAQTARDQIAVQEATIARLGKQVVAQQAAVD